jgi:hypothetical protein
VTYHLARLRSSHEELYGNQPDVDDPFAMMQQAVEHHQDAYLRVNLTKRDPANRRS